MQKFLLSGVLFFSLSAVTSAVDDPGDPEFVPDRLIVRFEPLAVDDPTARRPQIPGERRIRSIVRSRSDSVRVDGAHQICVVDLVAGSNVRGLADQVSRMLGVRYAEPDYILRADDVVPNDERFGDLWGLENDGVNGVLADADIDVTQAWDVTTGSSDVVVAIVDTGIDFSHPDLQDNLWVNPGESGDGRENDGIDNDGNGYVDDVFGYDFLRDDSDPSDSNSHGTHVAGTVAAVGNNGIGVTGVCWSSRIMALRFLGPTGNGPTSAAVEAIYYAIDNGAKIINNSWGGRAFSASLAIAVGAADDAGVLFVAAAGNGGDNIDETPHYPASYIRDNVISVAATTSEDILAGFSGFGRTSVDLSAPGTSTLSTTPPFVAGFSEDMEGTQLLMVPMTLIEEGDTGFWGVVESTFGEALAIRSDVQQSSPYSADVSAYLVTPPMDTRALRGLTVRFDYRYEIDPSDLFTVEVWDGSEWMVIFSRSTAGNFFESFFSTSRDLERFRNEAMRIRFGWSTDDVDNDAFGIELDNLSIQYIGNDYEAANAYGLKSGTSMATPHVSGVAALLLSYQPDMTVRELKERILFGGDVLPSLAGVTVSRRRLNAIGAFEYVGPLCLITPAGGEQWDVGQTYRIEWDCIGCFVFPVDVSLFQGGQFVRVLEEGFPSRAYIDWTVPNDIPNGGGYRVLVEGEAQFAINQQAFTVFRSTVYVDANALGMNDGSTWDDAYQDLNTAMADAIDGQSLWVATGVYFPAEETEPGDSRSASFSLRDGLKLHGGFAGGETSLDERDVVANPTVLSGDLAGDDGIGGVNHAENAYHVVTADGVDASAVLDGFVVTAGAADGAFPHELGGGMTATGGGDPTVRRCVFVDNRARIGGGVGHRGGQSQLIDCDFVANEAETEGGAIWNAINVTPMMLRCRFAGNQGRFGGAIAWQQFADTVIRGSVFVGNVADEAGGAMRMNNMSDQQISRCTFADNRAPRGATMALDTGLNESANVAMSNSILWNNASESENGASEELSFFNTPPTIDYSCVQLTSEQFEGVGTVPSDPGFVTIPGGQWSAVPVYDAARLMTILTDEGADWSVGELRGRFINPDVSQPRYWVVADNGANSVTVWGDLQVTGSIGSSYEIFDHHLAVGSPCVNVGDPSFGGENADLNDENVDGENLDLDGDDLVGCRVDMGADESAATQRAGDFSGDGFVGLTDYRFFQICMGAGQVAVEWGDACLCAFDFDDSGDLTLADFSAWSDAVEADNP